MWLVVLFLLVMRPLAGPKQLQYLCVSMYICICFLSLHTHVHIYDMQRFFISDCVFFKLEITVLVMDVHFSF